MGFIRLIHPTHYDATKNRFNNMALKKSSDGTGASIISVECIDGTGRNICDHIRKFYSEVSGEPPVFWRFDQLDLPDGYRIEQSTSHSGDECHHAVHDVSNNQLKKLITRVPIEAAMVCANGEHVPLTRDIITSLQDQYEQNVY